MTETTTEPAYETCPGPGCTPVTGPDVYRAEAHPVTCVWMMRIARRCDTCDELMRPGETTCPDVYDIDEDDPHGRLS